MAATDTIVRKGIVDLWNARLVRGAKWTAHGNPLVMSTVKELPHRVVGYREARRIHKSHMAAGELDYRMDAFLHTCTDDQHFDGAREGIWSKPERFIEMAKHFNGASIDFSTYADFPEPVLRWQIYRTRVIEFALAQADVPVVINARWGGCETWPYTIDELPEGETLLIGSVASGLRKLENRPIFRSGLRRIIALKHPTALVVIGSAADPVFEEARNQGVRIAQFDAVTQSAFKLRAGEALV